MIEWFHGQSKVNIMTLTGIFMQFRYVLGIMMFFIVQIADQSVQTGGLQSGQGLSASSMASCTVRARPLVCVPQIISAW